MIAIPSHMPIATLRHFVGRPHHDKWLWRIVSALGIVILIGLLEGRVGIMLGLIWFVVTAFMELRTARALKKCREEIGQADQEMADRFGKQLLIDTSLLAAIYALPTFGLSFASRSGQVLGLLLGGSILMNIAAQHVIHPSQVYLSLPVPALGFGACALVLAQAQPWVIAFALGVYILQTALMARAANRSAAALLTAQETAVAEARARGAAESANQTKTNFLATMSHELRTPLNAVIGYGEILKENAQFEQRTQDVDDIDKVLTSANRLLGLVHEVLDMSSIQAGTLALSPSTFDVKAEIERTLDGFRPLFSTGAVTLQVDLEAPLGVAVSDPLRFTQCLTQILSNAHKFTHQGTVTVTAARHTSATGDVISVVVTDTGIGMTPDQLEVIFEPFVQGDSGPTRKYGGTGLGLALARALARLMGGDVQASSTAGSGSKIELTIRSDLTAPI